MATCAEQLTKRLSTSNHLTIIGDTSRVAESIAHLDSIDPAFSATAGELLSNGNRAVENMLVLWLDSSHRMDAADREAEVIRIESGRHYTASEYVLHEIMRESSMERLCISPVRWNTMNSLRTSKTAHRMLVASGKIPQPTVNKAPEERDRYFHPMAVAMRILYPVTQEQRQQFVHAAEGFIEWASAQQDMNRILTSALRVGNIDPEVVIPYMNLCESITEPLREGAL